MTAEENFRLLQTIDDNRRFLLLMLQSNPHLLAKADKRVRELFNAIPPVPQKGFPAVTPTLDRPAF